MANRTRNIVLRVPVTAEERAMIERKMQQMGTGCFSVYARKMLIDGYVIRLDYSDVKAMTAELQKIGTNINQIAKRVNATGILRGQPVQRDMTQSWVDVQPEIAFVDPPRAGTGGGSAVPLIPVLHPVPEGHICLDPRRRRRREGVLQRFQLLNTLRFCFSQHIFRFRQTLVIVADDHTALPSTVLSQADSSFSIFPFSSHGLSSSPKMSARNSPTISAARLCISPVVWV